MGLLKAKMEKGICQPNCWSNSLVESLGQITGSNGTLTDSVHCPVLGFGKLPALFCGVVWP
jgi:hypothetical protein